ncbi:PREDICTED: uncharacterized protein LOC104731636 isoform X3 [Camelina sativa]|uniref:Uncharacterized protein LOC104731636 isoform X3 n=1 Tax=Camelina sativa TaxID=90675 RepID=A0ABM0V1D7_CAMSA|nr:PREDICTED: uncharacterized protein LOC104731636 isoform X3 [Camelina sativa]
MEEPGQETSIPGCRQTSVKNLFKSALRCLLTACSRQDFFDILSKFSGGEQERLYRLYTQVGPILDTVEQLIEEQHLDPLFSDETDVMAIANDLTTVKKNEIQRLTALLQRAEEQNRQKEARISLLKDQTQDFSDATARIEKLKAGFSGYFEGKDKLPPI